MLLFMENKLYKNYLYYKNILKITDHIFFISLFPTIFLKRLGKRLFDNIWKRK